MSRRTLAVLWLTAFSLCRAGPFRLLAITVYSFLHLFSYLQPRRLTATAPKENASLVNSVVLTVSALTLRSSATDGTIAAILAMKTNAVR